MGCLDPKMNKPRTLELLRAKGAVRAVVTFNGGHDEGSVEDITLTMADGSEHDLPYWYCGGYGMEDTGSTYRYVPLSTPANTDEELAELLSGPVDERFGTWAGAESTYGEVTWDVPREEVKITYTQEEPTEHHERISF